MLSGCEISGSQDDLTVTPSTIALSAGQSQAFTVSGGNTYTWYMGNNRDNEILGLGSLSSTSGSRVTYTAPFGIFQSTGVVLNVVSAIPGTTRGTNNSPPYDVTGYATIILTTNYSSTTNSTTFFITPSAVTIPPASNIWFTSSGGTAPYSWTVGDNGIGYIAAVSNNNALYGATALGTNMIIGLDASSNQASATIYQQY